MYGRAKRSGLQEEEKRRKLDTQVGVLLFHVFNIFQPRIGQLRFLEEYR